MAILLVGTDFSTRSDRALHRATLLARRERCDLLVAHVVEGQPDERIDAGAEEASKLLRAIALQVEDSEGIRCGTDLRFGSVAKQLAASAQESGAELMIIGPHRRSLLRDRFSHATASQIARHAMAPLIAANAVPAGEYRRVLIPTDFEEPSRRAARLARSLPFLGQAEPVLLHLFDAEAREMLGRSMVRGTEREEYDREMAEEARAQLASFARDVGLEHSRCIVRAASGSIAADIDRAAAEEAADLILLSRSNKGPVAEALIGSVTEGVLRESKRDVLIVPEAMRGE